MHGYKKWSFNVGLSKANEIFPTMSDQSIEEGYLLKSEEEGHDLSAIINN